MSTLQEGYQFFLYVNDGTRRYGKACRNGEIKIQRKHYPYSDLIGHKFGTIFEIRGKHLVPVDSPLNAVDVASVDVNDENDNRELVDNRLNQTLDQDDILKMRKDGMSGDAIIQELALSSTTFDGKTDFSKKKYLKKKAEKYIVRCMLVEANSQTVCEQQYMKNPVTLNYMRFDTLAYMLSVANIYPGSKVMVFDDCMGIVVASVMERLGGYGLVFAVNKNENRIPSYDCINRLNFTVSADQNEYTVDHTGTLPATTITRPARAPCLADYVANIRNTVLIWHLSDLLSVTPVDHATTPVPDDDPLPLPLPQPEPTKVVVPEVVYELNSDVPMTHKDGSPMSDKEIIHLFQKRLERRLREEWQPSLEQQQAMLRHGVGSLVVASNNPLEDLPPLLPYLAPSGVLVVYSQYQAVLAEVFAALKRSGQWINITMSENFMRKYQVLPMRTHPYMNMFNNGGFVLTATRVLNVNAAESAKEETGIRTGAGATSTLRRKRLKIM